VSPGRSVIALVIVVAAIAGTGAWVHDARAKQLVAVPLVTQTTVIRAYDRIRAAGLRVSIRNEFSVRSLCVPGASEQSPRHGTRVAVGSVVTVSTRPCAIASPSVLKSNPTATVPNFKSKLASRVIAWAERRSMFWEIRDAQPLSRSAAAHLFDNYRVVRQDPAPGARLRQGVMVRSGGAKGFRPTPITVWVTQR
jgi:hypothetical protein